MLIELAGIKSGLAVGRDEAIALLEGGWPGLASHPEDLLYAPSQWWRGDPDDVVRIRAEELELDHVHLLFGLGAIKDTRTSADLILEYLEADLRGRGPAEALEAGTLAVTLAGGQVPKGFESRYEEYRLRSLMSRDFPQVRDWNGLIPLADLFRSERIPVGVEPDRFFDQRYINYLAVHPNDLQRIHWRQFELLTAEFFQRSGYQVTITPPRGDGGVDVLARRVDPVTGPELIIAQAKRYSGTNLVEIEEVKAFWTDIQTADATKGLIVTTSTLEKGAREFCTARLYRYQFADQQTVQLWIAGLASKPSGPRTQRS